MNATELRRINGTIAQIESDLIKAEAAFADADSRLKQAERDRRSAIDTINNCQIEFDKAVARLRERSVPGSKWHPEMEQAEMERPDDTLILQPENIAQDETAQERSNGSSVAVQFDRLRTVAQPADQESPSRDSGGEAHGFRVVGPRPANSSGP